MYSSSKYHIFFEIFDCIIFNQRSFLILILEHDLYIMMNTSLLYDK